MTSGATFDTAFLNDLNDHYFRSEFVADQVRVRLALLIRALREDPARNWSQSELGKEMGKPQSVVSRLEDPDYGKASLQTLLEVAAAYGLPLWIDMPEWEDWLRLIRDVPGAATRRHSFNADRLAKCTIDAGLVIEAEHDESEAGALCDPQPIASSPIVTQPKLHDVHMHQNAFNERTRFYAKMGGLSHGRGQRHGRNVASPVQALPTSNAEQRPAINASTVRQPTVSDPMSLIARSGVGTRVQHTPFAQL